MFSYKLINSKGHCLRFQNNVLGLSGQIDLHHGAALSELTLKDKKIINELPAAYDDTYASAILFPFANRIKKGKYTFQDREYALTCNGDDGRNALHGLISHALFSCDTIISQQDQLIIHLSCVPQKVEGFPYDYAIKIKYTFLQHKMLMHVCIENHDKHSFPYALGWHPYFYISDIADSQFLCHCTKEVLHDEDQVLLAVNDLLQPKERFYFIADPIDDCYFSVDPYAILKTPEYQLKMASSIPQTWWQLYKPPFPHAMAIEPMTAPSDVFNHGIGLEVLAASDTIAHFFKLELLD